MRNRLPGQKCLSAGKRRLSDSPTVCRSNSLSPQLTHTNRQSPLKQHRDPPGTGTAPMSAVEKQQRWKVVGLTTVLVMVVLGWWWDRQLRSVGSYDYFNLNRGQSEMGTEWRDRKVKIIEDLIFEEGPPDLLGAESLLDMGEGVIITGLYDGQEVRRVS
eukprot:GHVN01004082.1.p1 GENE.GHVN01004082.1~~GHVN01004082.1.p1  ORF type:complete len:159 (+),score=25.99 GHVN01004082.1:78-554(+)